MRTKIIATIGPKSESEAMIRAFIEKGVTIFRMNFSHCTHEEYVARREKIMRIGRELDVAVGVLQDLQGPRIRVGMLPEEGRILTEGDEIVFSTRPVTSGYDSIYIDDPYLHADIRVGDPLLLANGEMELVVERVDDTSIHTRVIRGGTLFSRKGVNVPRTKLTQSGITQKDIDDVTFALGEGVEYVAISFVQNAGDIEKLRTHVGTKAKIIAKIETQLALDNIDSIIRASDAIMIARGDLGIEVPMERLPLIQKNLIRHGMWLDIPTITATQMLYSMINHPRPTRAEVSDVAQAVWDGTDAVMLSDETASGDYPLQAVDMMVKIVREAESSRFERPIKL